MKKSGLVWLVVIAVSALGVPTVMAQTQITNVVPSATYDACSKTWIITLSGDLQLDAADMSVSSFSVSMKDPNNTQFLFSGCNISWTAPAPGKSTGFDAISIPVMVSGNYACTLTMNYIDSNGMPMVFRVTVNVNAM